MKTFSRTLQMLAATALATTVLLSQAVASPIVSIVPSDQTKNIGDHPTIDIIVSGLTEPVGGFSFTLSFNDAILSGDGYNNAPGGKMGAAPLDLSGGFAGGAGSPLDIFFVADPTADQAGLSGLQGPSFTLTSVFFTAVANGLSNLTLTDVVLSNWDGTATLAGVEVQNGRICVGGNCQQAPEPATLLLLGGALGALGIIRRRKQVA
jgi:PEP-CTERM motif